MLRFDYLDIANKTVDKSFYEISQRSIALLLQAATVLEHRARWAIGDSEYDEIDAAIGDMYDQITNPVEGGGSTMKWGCRQVLQSAIQVPHNTWTTIPFGGAQIDNDVVVNSGGVYEVQTDGVYFVSIHCGYGWVQLNGLHKKAEFYIMKNGSEYWKGSSLQGWDFFNYAQNSVCMDLGEGDEISVETFHYLNMTLNLPANNINRINIVRL